MGRKKLKIDVPRIIKLYRQGLSTRRIAALIDVSHDTVLRRLKEARQPLRRWRLPDEER